jgi:peroxiredoxin/predicted negative regulator of RcsB-dependent stress response
MKSAKTAIMAISVILLWSSAVVLAQGDPAAEYQEIIDQLTTMQRNRTDMGTLIDTTERLLIAFIEKYPDSKEAASAHMLLGQVYSNIGRAADGIEHLEVYMKSDAEKNPREEIMAKSSLASAYLAEEKFDEAERLLREVAESDAVVDNRIKSMASQQLARIGTLRKLGIGMPAIDFSASSPDGGMINLKDFRGKVILLDFWAAWCAPCKQEMPNVKNVYNKYHDKGFEIIGISLDNSRAQFERYVQEQQIGWPQVFDGKGWQSEVGQLYAVGSIPATFLLDREGKIARKNLRGPELEKAVKELVGAE